MRIVCAPDSFKESMSALAAAEAMARGILRVVPDADCDLVPMADGGEGTVEALTDALGGTLVSAACHDALGRGMTAQYSYVESKRLAVIEVAAASGLTQIRPTERDPLRATSRGTGELIRAALDLGARRFIVGLGGSATNDAGAGMISALGARLQNSQGAVIAPGGAALARLASVDLAGMDPRLGECEFELACDVDNPLLGPTGASAVFGPQKGASPETVAILDEALANWANVVEAATGRAVRHRPGAGAAGGLGAAFLAFLNCSMRPGVEIVADAVSLAQRIEGADWVFTGEGGINFQTLHGKTPWGVLQVARSHGVKVVMFGGLVAPEAAELLDHGVSELVSIVPHGQPLAEALRRGPQNLADAVEQVVRRLVGGQLRAAIGAPVVVQAVRAPVPGSCDTLQPSTSRD